MANKASTKRRTATASDSIPTAEQIREFVGEEIYSDITRAVLFTEFVIDRMKELGFDCPDDVPLHLSLDYHLVMLYMFIEEYMYKGLRLPNPESSRIKLRESMTE